MSYITNLKFTSFQSYCTLKFYTNCVSVAFNLHIENGFGRDPLKWALICAVDEKPLKHCVDTHLLFEFLEC